MDIVSDQSINSKHLIQDFITKMTPTTVSLPKKKKKHNVSTRRKAVPLAERRWSQSSLNETPKRLLKLAIDRLSNSPSGGQNIQRAGPLKENSASKLNKLSEKTSSPRNSDSFQIPIAIGRRGRQVAWNKKLHSPFYPNSFAAAVDAQLVSQEEAETEDASTLDISGKDHQKVSAEASVDSLTLSSFTSRSSPRKKGKKSDSFKIPDAVGRRGRQVQWNKNLHSPFDADSFAAAVNDRLADGEESSSASTVELPDAKESSTSDRSMKGLQKANEESPDNIPQQQIADTQVDTLNVSSITAHSSPRKTDKSAHSSTERRQKSDSFQFPAAIGRRGGQVQWNKRLHSPFNATSFASRINARLSDQEESSSSSSIVDVDETSSTSAPDKSQKGPLKTFKEAPDVTSLKKTAAVPDLDTMTSPSFTTRSSARKANRTSRSSDKKHSKNRLSQSTRKSSLSFNTMHKDQPIDSAGKSVSHKPLILDMSQKGSSKTSTRSSDSISSEKYTEIAIDPLTTDIISPSPSSKTSHRASRSSTKKPSKNRLSQSTRKSSLSFNTMHKDQPIDSAGKSVSKPLTLDMSRKGSSKTSTRSSDSISSEKYTEIAIDPLTTDIISPSPSSKTSHRASRSSTKKPSKNRLSQSTRKSSLSFNTMRKDQPIDSAGKSVSKPLTLDMSRKGSSKTSTRSSDSISSEKYTEIAIDPLTTDIISPSPSSKTSHRASRSNTEKHSKQHLTQNVEKLSSSLDVVQRDQLEGFEKTLSSSTLDFPTAKETAIGRRDGQVQWNRRLHSPFHATSFASRINARLSDQEESSSSSSMVDVDETSSTSAPDKSQKGPLKTFKEAPDVTSLKKTAAVPDLDTMTSPSFTTRSSARKANRTSRSSDKKHSKNRLSQSTQKSSLSFNAMHKDQPIDSADMSVARKPLTLDMSQKGSLKTSNRSSDSFSSEKDAEITINPLTTDAIAPYSSSKTTQRASRSSTEKHSKRYLAQSVEKLSSSFDVVHRDQVDDEPSSSKESSTVDTSQKGSQKMLKKVPNVSSSKISVTSPVDNLTSSVSRPNPTPNAANNSSRASSEKHSNLAPSVQKLSSFDVVPRGELEDVETMSSSSTLDFPMAKELARRAGQVQWNKGLHSPFNATSLISRVNARQADQEESTSDYSTVDVDEMNKASAPDKFQMGSPNTFEGTHDVTSLKKTVVISVEPLTSPSFTTRSTSRAADRTSRSSAKKHSKNRLSQSTQKSSPSFDAMHKGQPIDIANMTVAHASLTLNMSQKGSSKTIKRNSDSYSSEDDAEITIDPLATDVIAPSSSSKTIHRASRSNTEKLSKQYLAQSVQTLSFDVVPRDQEEDDETSSSSTEDLDVVKESSTVDTSQKGSRNMLKKVSNVSSSKTGVTSPVDNLTSSVTRPSPTPKTTNNLSRASPEKHSKHLSKSGQKFTSHSRAAEDSTGNVTKVPDYTLLKNSGIPLDPPVTGPMSSKFVPEMQDVSSHQSAKKLVKHPKPAIASIHSALLDGSCQSSSSSRPTYHQPTLQDYSNWSWPKPVASSTPARSISDQIDHPKTTPLLFTPKSINSYSALMKTRRSLLGDKQSEAVNLSKNSSMPSNKKQQHSITSITDIPRNASHQDFSSKQENESPVTRNKSTVSSDKNVDGRDVLSASNKKVSLSGKGKGNSSVLGETPAPHREENALRGSVLADRQESSKASGQRSGHNVSSSARRSLALDKSIVEKRASNVVGEVTHSRKLSDARVHGSKGSDLSLASFRGVRRPADVLSEAETTDSASSEEYLPPRKKKKPSDSATDTERPNRNRRAALPGLLPMICVKSNFEHFSRKRTTRETAEAVHTSTNAFFGAVAQQLDTLLARKKGKCLNPGDVIRFFKDCNIFNEPFSDLVRKYYPTEFQEKLVPVAQAYNKIKF